MTITPTPRVSSTQGRVAGWLSSEEFSILEAACDTLIPSLEPPAGSSEAVAAYYRRSAGDLHVAMGIAETLAQESEENQKEFHQLLALMASPALGFLFVGSAKPFKALSLRQREKYLLAMANSPLAQLRQGYQAIKRLSGFIFFSIPDAQGINPNWEILDYTPPTPPLQDAPRPIKPLNIERDTTLECDAVVIGSGAGGGVVAGELALAGKDVIVLEKGGYNSEADFTLQEAQAMPELYLKRGALTTKDLSVIILAGSTLGGGTVVNWTTSFRTPPDVLEEWERVSGLADFTGSALQDSFAAVEQRIQVNSENSEHNRQNQILFDGAKALGYHAGTLRRNAVGCEQRCGTCGFGCRYGSKQSTLKTYLQDAYEHGARIIVRCSADRVLIQDGKAIGVEATVTNGQNGETYTVTVRAKAVIVAAGAVHSPAVLLRSGLANRHIGRHFHLHPTTTIGGIYPDKVYPWQGVMQSAYSDQFAHLTENYGYKLEVPPAHPGLLGLSVPWYSAQEYRALLAEGASAATFIVLTRDKGEGSVTVDSAGEPVVNYVVSPFDRAHLLHGLRQGARMHMAAGARTIFSLHNKRTMLELTADKTRNEQLLHEFDRQLERHSMEPNRIMMFTAHQMGTCRMGADANQSVVDGHGEVHDVKGLFVCDGSVFPAASGVNPMLSIMALAHRSSQYIKTVL
jgi:choline dehydrogenase-like flavoprotein